MKHETFPSLKNWNPMDKIAPRPYAVFSDCGRYRYLLTWRTGVDNDRIMVFCGANPSKAGQLDAQGNIRSDPTISRMRKLAASMDFGILWAVNARSYVSTDPSGVPPDPEGIGDLTDQYIRLAALSADLFVCAFGQLAGPARGSEIIEMVRNEGKVPHALALTKDGTPRHPRGIPNSARPFPI